MIRPRRPNQHRRLLRLARSLAAGLPLWLACGSVKAPPPAEPPADTPAAAPARAETRTPLVPPRFLPAARYSEEHQGLALLVIERGEVVVETGQNGGSADEPRPLYSGTKSFWGVLAAAAAEDGLLELDEPVVATLPEFERDRWKRRMTIRQLLDFTSGLEAGFVPLRRDHPRSWYRRALTLEMIAAPGERFQYGPSHLFVFGELLRRKLAPRGQDPLDYLTARIFEPIGLEVSDWDRDDDGNPDLPSGAVLRPREWAKFGTLIRDGGRAGDVQVVARQDLDACFRGSEVNPAYGLAFWLNAPEPAPPKPARGGGMLGRLNPNPVFHPGDLPDLVVAAGAANQRLYVSREADLVVVRFGEADRTWKDADFLSLLLAAKSHAPERAPAASTPR